MTNFTSISDTSGSHPVTQVPFVASTLQELPRDLLGLIGSFSDRKAVQSLASTSQRISRATIEETGLEVCSGLYDFIQAVGERFPQLQERLNLVKQQINPSDCPIQGLKSTKEHALLIKKQIIDVLMTLSREELDSMVGIPKPRFLENIFQIANICTRIREAYAITNVVNRNIALQRITEDLANSGDVPRAIELANTFTEQSVKSYALQGIAKHLTNFTDIHRATEVAYTLGADVYQRIALESIFEAALGVGNIDKAVEFAHATLNQNVRAYALARISVKRQRNLL